MFLSVAIVDLQSTKYRQHNATKTITTPINNIELFEQAHQNPDAERVIQQSAQAIATLCCNLKASLDLDNLTTILLKLNLLERSFTIEKLIQRHRL